MLPIYQYQAEIGGRVVVWRYDGAQHGLFRINAECLMCEATLHRHFKLFVSAGITPTALHTQLAEIYGEIEALDEDSGPISLPPPKQIVHIAVAGYYDSMVGYGEAFAAELDGCRQCCERGYSDVITIDGTNKGRFPKGRCDVRDITKPTGPHLKMPAGFKTPSRLARCWQTFLSPNQLDRQYFINSPNPLTTGITGNSEL